MDVDRIVSAVSEKYGNCQYYRDKGVIRCKRFGKNFEYVFATKYNHPGKLKYQEYTIGAPKTEYRIYRIADGLVNSQQPLSERKRMHINEEKCPIHFRWIVAKLNEFLKNLSFVINNCPSPLESGLGGIRGGTNGSPCTILSLLYPKAHSWPWVKLKNKCLIGEELVQEFDCFKIRVYHPNFRVIFIWISKEDFLIRKIRLVDNFESSWIAKLLNSLILFSNKRCLSEEQFNSFQSMMEDNLQIREVHFEKVKFAGRKTGRLDAA